MYFCTLCSGAQVVVGRGSSSTIQIVEGDARSGSWKTADAVICSNMSDKGMDNVKTSNFGLDSSW